MATQLDMADGWADLPGLILDVRRPFGVHAVAPTCPAFSDGVRLVIFDAPVGGFEGAIELDSALTPSLPARHAHGMETESSNTSSCCGLQ